MLKKKNKREKLGDVYSIKKENKRYLSTPFHPNTVTEISDDQEIFLYPSLYGARCSTTVRKLIEGETPFGITQEA